MITCTMKEAMSQGPDIRSDGKYTEVSKRIGGLMRVGRHEGGAGHPGSLCMRRMSEVHRLMAVLTL